MRPAELDVTHHFVELPGLRMHYVEAGEGPLVLLLHGFPENWWSWRHQLGPLAKAGFRVVAPDLRGYGETGKQGPYDLDTLTADVCHLIEALGEKRARIVGHDWGGGLAWHLAAHRPAFCERLAILNCPHPARMQTVLLGKPSLKQLKKSWYFFFFQLPWLPEWVLTRDDAANTARTIKASVLDRSHFTEEELRPFRDGIQRPGAASAMVGWYRAAVRDAFRKLRNPPHYPQITAPTLLLWGMEDPALGYAELVPGTEQYVPQLSIEQIPNAGHFVQAEKPAKVNAALEAFLRRAPPSNG